MMNLEVRHPLAMFPSDIYVNLTNVINYRDLCHLCITCKGLHKVITQVDVIWETMARRIWQFDFLVKSMDSFQKIIMKTGEEPKLLTLKIKSCSAAAWSRSYAMENILHKNGVFCTSTGCFANVDMVFTISIPDGALCFIKAVEIIGPSSGFTRPIESAIVFISQDVDDTFDTAESNGMTKEQYVESQNIKPTVKRMPDVYLSCPAKGGVKVTLKDAVPAKSVHLKLIQGHSGIENIDVQFFGVYGFIVLPV